MTGTTILAIVAGVLALVWGVFLVLLPLTHRTSIRYSSTGGNTPGPVPMGCLFTIGAILVLVLFSAVVLGPLEEAEEGKESSSLLVQAEVWVRDAGTLLAIVGFLSCVAFIVAMFTLRARRRVDRELAGGTVFVALIMLGMFAIAAWVREGPPEDDETFSTCATRGDADEEEDDDSADVWIDPDVDRRRETQRRIDEAIEQARKKRQEQEARELARPPKAPERVRELPEDEDRTPLTPPPTPRPMPPAPPAGPRPAPPPDVEDGPAF